MTGGGYDPETMTRGIHSDQPAIDYQAYMEAVRARSRAWDAAGGQAHLYSDDGRGRYCAECGCEERGVQHRRRNP